MTGKKKYIPISKLPRLLQRDMTLIVNKKPTELKLMKEEFHRKRLKEKEAKIIEMYEMKQRKVIERVVTRERPFINNKQTVENINKPLSITKQEPVKDILPGGEHKKSMAEIQAHFRRTFKVNAPRRSTVPDIEKPLIKRSAGRDRSNLLPPIVHSNTNQYQHKNTQSKSRPMSASGGSSSPKEVSEYQSTMTGMKNLKPGFTDDEKKKSFRINGNDDERDIVGISEDELEGLQDFYKWKIELMRVKEDRLFKKTLKGKIMSGESVDGLKEGFEEGLLVKQWEILYELAERQQEQDKMEKQRIEKVRQEAEESKKRAAMERKRQEKINQEQEANAKREERKIALENRAREERERCAKAQQEAEEHEEEPPLEHVISHSPPPEEIYQKTKRMRNSNSDDFDSKSNFQERILFKQNELLAELAIRERELKIIQERRLELEREEAEESEERTPRTLVSPKERTPRTVPSPEERNARSLPEERSPRATSPSTRNNFEQAEPIDYPDLEFYTQAAEDASLTDSQPFDLKECRICGRRFAAERLQKHESCCKTANKKRKKFDPAKKRWQGTDALLYHGKAEKKAAPPKRKKDFKKQHEEFRKTVEYAKKVQEIEKNGGDIRQITPPPPTVNPDYVQCPHCERRFNAAAAERHIPRCVDIKGRPLRKR